jgi:hypothetical protein
LEPAQFVIAQRLSVNKSSLAALMTILHMSERTGKNSASDVLGNPAGWAEVVFQVRTWMTHLFDSFRI